MNRSFKSIKFLLLIFLTFNLSSRHLTIAQEYKVLDTVILLEGKKVTIPFISANDPKEQEYFDNLNKQLRKQFKLTDNAPLDSLSYDDFVGSLSEGGCSQEEGYLDIKYQIEIEQEIVHLKMQGNFLNCIYDQPEWYFVLDYFKNDFFFDLTSGDPMSFPQFNFHELFSLSGYLDFIHNKWLKTAQPIYDEAIECASGSNPYCSIYDLSFSIRSSNSFSVYNKSDCYPRVVRGCSPGVSVAIVPSEYEKYFSEIGLRLVNSRLKKQSPFISIQEEISIKKQTPSNTFLFGKINKKYPFKMGLSLLPEGDIEGEYFYDKKSSQTLKLKGNKIGDIINLTEYLNEKVTGHISIRNDGPKAYAGTWTSVDKTNQYSIEFNEIIE